ncbi:MAG: hypothetical protein ACOYCD_01460 [Kiritimatiellia bacterium]
MRCLSLKSGLVALGLIIASWHGTSAEIKVGIYAQGTGGKGLHDALLEAPAIKADMITEMRLNADDLFKYDVLVIGSLKGTEQGNIQAIRIYVNAGGGVLLNHDACGFRGWKEPLFPEVCRGLRTSQTATLMPVVDTGHALIKDLPTEYTHAYSDHIVLESGPKGTVIVNDKDGTPAVVAGEAGHGRVVGNGAVSGYWADMALQRQGEGAPQGGELQVVLNAVRWLGEKSVTALAADELNRRKKAAMADQILAETTLSSDTDWFGDEMLRGCYWVRPPVNELGGKFFMFCDRNIVLMRMDRARLDLYMRQLKWMGVTDIFYNGDFSGGRIYRPTDISPEVLDGIPTEKGQDLLMDVIDSAADAGLNVWAMWHSSRVPDGMAAYDQNGNKYLEPDYGCIMDVLSPAYRELCHALLDEYAAKYNKHGNFKGIYYDELFFNCIDFHGDDLKLFDDFCQERFGESLPADIGDKLAKTTKWVDPTDKWWRRYILFKNWANTDFIKDLTDYCHKKGLQILVELRPNAIHKTGWCWGIDNEALTRLGADYYFVASADSCEPCYVYTNALVGGHVGNTWGYYNTVAVRGHAASVHFVDNQFWRLLVYGNNPKGGPQVERFIRNTREWADGTNLAGAAILYNQNTLQMILGAEAPKAVSAECALLNRISIRQDADMLLAGAVEYYKNYSVLLAPPYSLRGMPEARYKALCDYVEGGGTLIVMSECTVSREDLTEEQDRGEALCGVRMKGEKQDIEGVTLPGTETTISLSGKMEVTPVEPLEGVEVLAVCEGIGTPAATRKRLGAGQVLAIHVDVMREIMQANQGMEDWLCGLVGEASKPAITVSGELKIMTSVKKGNWVAVTLLSEKIPGKGVLKLDMAGLGITNSAFRVIMLGKQMEITRPGDWFRNKDGWTAAELAKGIGVTIVKDNDEKLALPNEFNLAEFNEKDAEYINRVTRKTWDAAGALKRHYEHEIVVIAPADEIAKGRP